MMDREEVRRALFGPVMSLPTPFLTNDEIDHDGVRRILDYTIEEGGSKTIIMTYGDSLYTLLSEDEIAELTQVVVQHVAGRAMVVASDNFGSTRQTIQFARYARGLGADMLMVRPPDWAASCTVDTIVEHFATIAAEGIPLMMVTNFFETRPLSFSLEVLKRLCEEIDGIYAVKDDVLGEFARRLSLLVYERWAVLTSGTKREVLNAVPYGCDGYMSNFILFKPLVAHEFHRAIRENNPTAVQTFINEYDVPFWDFITRCEGGADAAVHGILELNGLAKRWRRKPYYSLNDKHLEKLADFFKIKGWL